MSGRKVGLCWLPRYRRNHPSELLAEAIEDSPALYDSLKPGPVVEVVEHVVVCEPLSGQTAKNPVQRP